MNNKQMLGLCSHTCVLQHALEYFHRALTIRERSLGISHPNTASTVSNIAVLLLNMGDLVRAEEMHKVMARLVLCCS
jgi:hypothetical protein